MPDLSYATDAGILLGAIGAGAACAGPIQNFLAAQAARRPDLRTSAFPIIGDGKGSKAHVSMVVVNDGGTAQNVTCVIQAGNKYVSNPFGSGVVTRPQ